MQLIGMEFIMRHFHFKRKSEYVQYFQNCYISDLRNKFMLIVFFTNMTRQYFAYLLFLEIFLSKGAGILARTWGYFQLSACEQLPAVFQGTRRYLCVYICIYTIHIFYECELDIKHCIIGQTDRHRMLTSMMTQCQRGKARHLVIRSSKDKGGCILQGIKLNRGQSWQEVALNICSVGCIGINRKGCPARGNNF